MPSPAIPGALAEELRAAQHLGAIGPGSIETHAAHALGFLTALGEVTAGSDLLDLGSGGGIPGLVIAGARPDLVLTLLDGRLERAARLRESIERLGWVDRVAVIGERAEVAAHGDWRFRFDIVVARAFGRPSVTAECAAAFLTRGGRLVVSEPPAAEAGARWPAGPLGELGLVLDSECAVPYRYVVLRALRACPDRFPRRTGIPAKRPIF